VRASQRGWRTPTSRGGGADLGSISPATQPSTVRFIAVAISSCEVYGQQKLRIPLRRRSDEQESARGRRVGRLDGEGR